MNDSPPNLTEAFQRARRNLSFASALLLAWEFIGISIEPIQKIGGSFQLKIKSPEAAPAILICLVCYFSVRLWIEWNQCVLSRRELTASKVDYFLSLILAFCSIAVFGYQQQTGFQIFQLLSGFSIPITGAFFIMGVSLIEAITYGYLIWGAKRSVIFHRNRVVMLIVFAIFFVASAYLGFSSDQAFGSKIDFIFSAIALLVGCVFGFLDVKFSEPSSIVVDEEPV